MHSTVGLEVWRVPPPLVRRFDAAASVFAVRVFCCMHTESAACGAFFLLLLQSPVDVVALSCLMHCILRVCTCAYMLLGDLFDSQRTPTLFFSR